MDWNQVLLDQLVNHWAFPLRPRLEGLTDEEYLWEPVPDAWSLRRRGDRLALDRTSPEPVPAPFTTIAWRLNHVIVGVLAMRVADHFGGPPVDHDTWPYAETAAGALEQLDAAYDAWVAGVRGLGEKGLARPCGPAEGPYADAPLASLVTHIHREVIHHGAEICTLRDLHTHTKEH
jgi:hypothetical protein